jgi:hypothetical protein
MAINLAWEVMNYAPTRRERRGIPLVPADDDELFKRDRRSFTRMLSAKVYAHSHQGQSPEDIIARAWPNDDGAMLITRASVVPDSTSGSASALAITKTGPLRLLTPSSAAARLFEERLRVSLDGIYALNIPYPSAYPTPLWTGESGPIPVVQGSLGHAVLGPTRKLAFITTLTRELDNASLEDGSSILGAMLDKEARLALDASVFDNQAGSSQRPAGLLYNVTPITATAISAGVMTAIAWDVAALAGAMSDARVDPSNMVLCCNPRQGTALLMSRGMQTLPLRVLMSPMIPAKTIIAIAPEGVASAYGGEPQVEVSNNAGALHMEDTTPLAIGTPGAPPTVAAPTRSVWQTDSVAVRVKMRAAWSVLVPGAVQAIVGTNW